MDKLLKTLKNYNPPFFVSTNEPMSKHSSFETGGPAELFIRPSNYEEIKFILNLLKKEDKKPFILGGGANILVSDEGIKGVVIDTSGINSVKFDKTNKMVIADCGFPVSDLAKESVLNGFEGLENFYGLPGSIGGSIYMNARCYEREISDVIVWTEIMNNNGEIERLPYNQSEWSYKNSPFQNPKTFILRGAFKITPTSSPNLKEKMVYYKENRKEKGHFAYPCAGSTFKNNRAFGMPTGKIIDSLNLKGYNIGDAAISDFHANIIVNKGKATSKEIRELIEFVQKRVKTETGFDLEPEVEFIGSW